ncbi:MAG: putative lyase [bacterium ADurb.Bin363]|nr:MAG: putative lyase [bacterium ADurb.Bin363]
MTLSELVEQLKNDMAEVRRRAVHELSKIPGPEAFSHIVEALDDKDDEVRESAIYALSDTKNPDSLKHLLKPKVLFDQNSNIRTATIRALGNFRKVGGLPVIGKLLELSRDPEWFVRNTAISIINSEVDAIKAEGDIKSVFSLLYILQLPDKEVRKKAVESLIEIGRDYVDILIDSIAYQSPSLKAGITRVLGEFKCHDALPVLIRLSDDENDTVREEIARALGNIGGNETVLPLLNLLGDIHPGVRQNAVTAIVNQGEDVVESLIAELRHTSNKYKKKAIIEALGKIKSDNAIMPLIDCLQDIHHLVRLTTINSLVELNSPKSIQHLMDVLCVNPIDIKVLMDIALNNSDLRLRIRAIRAMGELKDTRAIPELTQILINADSEFLEREIMNALIKIKGVVWAKICALQVLGRLKIREALPFILLHLSDTDENIIYQALDAIKIMKASEAIKEVMALAEHSESMIRNKVVSVLGTIGIGNPEVTDIVLARLKDPDRHIRKEAARVLGKLGDKKAIPFLEEIIRTCDFWSVRRNACNALNNLGVDKYSVENEVVLKETTITCPYKDDSEQCPVKYVVSHCVINKA